MKQPLFTPRPSSRAGFTLLEMLVCIGIVAILAAAGLAAYKGAVTRAAMTREIAAARSLITAYTLYSSENDGELMPVVDKRVSSVWFQPYNRNVTYFEAPHRYPFRLAPYFDYKLSGTIFVNENAKQIEKYFGRSGGMNDYGVSCFPAFGMNHYFVGGYVGLDGQLRYPNECLSRLPQATKTSLIVFASAGGTLGTTTVQGYSMVDPPRGKDRIWSSTPWEPGANAANYGCVAARYDGKAVVAFLNGSVKAMKIEDLRDMRLWSHNAAMQDDPNYTFTE